MNSWNTKVKKTDLRGQTCCTPLTHVISLNQVTYDKNYTLTSEVKCGLKVCFNIWTVLNIITKCYKA